jgi:hypothetical protein
MPSRARCAAVASLAAALAVAVAGAAPGSAADAVLRPGTYVQLDPQTRKPAAVGNTIVLVRGRTRRLSFSVNAIRALDLDQGFVAGTLPANGRRVTWQQKSGGISCRLTFTATASGLAVEQDVAFGDCGFGAGVSANGSYVRSADDGKPGIPPGS